MCTIRIVIQFVSLRYLSAALSRDICVNVVNAPNESDNVDCDVYRVARFMIRRCRSKLFARCEAEYRAAGWSLCLVTKVTSDSIGNRRLVQLAHRLDVLYRYFPQLSIQKRCKSQFTLDENEFGGTRLASDRFRLQYNTTTPIHYYTTTTLLQHYRRWLAPSSSTTGCSLRRYRLPNICLLGALAPEMTACGYKLYRQGSDMTCEGTGPMILVHLMQPSTGRKIAPVSIL